MAERAGDSKRAARRMPRPWALIGTLAVLAIAGLAVGCGGGDDDDTGVATQTTETTETTAPEEGGGEAGGEEGGGEGEEAGGISVAAGDPKAGQGVFAEECAVCHGATGAGGNVGPSLQEPELAQESGDVVEQIVEGGGGMPAFGEQLNDQEIADVSAYVVKDLAQR